MGVEIKQNDLEKVFRYIDEDNDGFILFNQFSRFIQKLCNIREIENTRRQLLNDLGEVIVNDITAYESDFDVTEKNNFLFPGRNLKAMLSSLRKKSVWGGGDPCSPSNSNQKHFSPKPNTFSLFKPFCWTNKSFGRKLSFFSLKRKDKYSTITTQFSSHCWILSSRSNEKFISTFPPSKSGGGGGSCRVFFADSYQAKPQKHFWNQE